MEARNWRLVLLSLCLFFSSGLGRTVLLRDDEENQEMASHEFSTQLDSVPVVNPTTPGTGNPYPPLSNPTTPQSPYTTGQQPPTTPYMTPTTTNPTPTTPYMTPTTTNPTTQPTTPTNPYTNPYTTPTTTTPPSPITTPTTTPNPAISGGGGGGGGGGGSGGGGSGQWCIASQSAQDKALKVALDYACGYGADCSAIQQGGSCYNPDTLRDHASYAFNDYYQKNPAPTSCAFGGAATLTTKDPSNGNCHYSSSRTPSMSPPTYVSPPNTQTPPTASGTMNPTAPGTMTPTTMTPTTMTPTTPSMTIPDGASVYGPTGSPNIATSSASQSLLILFTSFGLLASLHHVENYI